jgi:hypothetical protein
MTPEHKKRSWLVVRYRLEAYGTLLSGLALDYGKHPAGAPSRTRLQSDRTLLEKVALVQKELEPG